MTGRAVLDEARDFFVHNVLPRIPYEQKRAVLDRYPHVQIHRAGGFMPLHEVPIFMLVALTGTGKTTTLDQVQAIGEAHYSTDIPTRRELADFLVIPTAQVLSGERVRPVSDRVERFRLTRTFAALMGSGGFALAYAWLQYAWDGETPLLSDGIRGAGEIDFALRHFGAWQVVELWIDPVTRLIRLSGRNDDFDRAAPGASIALDFLPEAYRAAAQEHIATGEISRQALRIVEAEAENYDMLPHRANHPRYHLIESTNLSPHETARIITERMKVPYANR